MPSCSNPASATAFSAMLFKLVKVLSLKDVGIPFCILLVLERIEGEVFATDVEDKILTSFDTDTVSFDASNIDLCRFVLSCDADTDKPFVLLGFALAEVTEDTKIFRAF